MICSKSPPSARAKLVEMTGKKTKLTNPLGSTTITTDTAGTVVSELRYNPWGETRFSS